MQRVYGTEDCLVLSVYSPKILLDQNKPLPVLVWIHGGGFSMDSGSCQFYGPEYFMDYEIVGFHTTYSWNIKWQKCAGMDLNGCIFKKMNEN